MRRVLLVFLFACGHHPSASTPPPPPTAPDAAAAPAPDAAPATASCTADESHCCMPDGRLVVPGGCQPSYPSHVQPATDRGDDGTCKPIPCTLKCLPEDAMIATPDGDVPVTQLHTGDAVWTAAADGTRVAATIEQVSSTARTEPHLLVELTLADGRVVRASAGHPTAGGADIVDLAAGDALDGSTIEKVRYVEYDGAATWDLRPSGATGTYWANGVLLGSTLPMQQATPPPPPPTILCDIVMIEKAGGGVRTIMNCGTDQGVQVGWHAALIDGNGNAVGHGDFLISAVRKRSSEGVVKLSITQVKNGTLQVRLTP